MIHSGLFQGKKMSTRKGHVTLDAPLDHIPLHVRGGHIIPTQEPANNTAFRWLAHWPLDLGPVYTGPDKFLHGQKLTRFHRTFTRDRRNWTNFWTAKCASLGPEKSRSTFWPARFWFRVDSCKHPNRATFCSDSSVKAWNLDIFLPGCGNRTRVNTTATEFARIHVNSRSRNKIRPCKNLPGPVYGALAIGIKYSLRKV